MPFEHVLLLLKGYLGDAVMLTPLLKGLVDSGAKVDIYTDPGVIELLRETFPTVSYHRSRKISNPFEFLKERSDLKAARYRLAIVVNRSFRSALLAATAGIPVRVGHDEDGRGFLLTQRVAYNADRSESDSCLDLAEAIGWSLPHSHPALKVSEAAVREVGPMLEGATVGIQPGARHPYKQVPIAAMAQVCRALHEDGGKLVLLGGKEERSAGEELTTLLDFRPVNLIGALSLPQSMAAASLLRVVVGGDTGFMHIAAAMGTPTVSSFGVTSAAKWGHNYPPHHVILSPTGDMRDLPAEEILGAARKVLLDGRGPL